MVVYDSAYVYVDQASDLVTKIARIDAVIVALEEMSLKAAATGNIAEYSLDDGQTKIRTAYRDIVQVEASITAFERIKQRYINQLNGRMTRLVDGKNFTGPC